MNLADRERAAATGDRINFDGARRRLDLDAPAASEGVDARQRRVRHGNLPPLARAQEVQRCDVVASCRSRDGQAPSPNGVSDIAGRCVRRRFSGLDRLGGG